MSPHLFSLRLFIVCLIAIVCSLGMQATHAAATEIAVTGQFLEVNGHDEIPRGLFGVHAMYGINPQKIDEWGIELVRQIHHNIPGGPTNPNQTKNLKGLSMVIDCQGDRYQPAWPLYRKDYAQAMADAGKKLGERTAASEQISYIELWNEPYLNWADRSRINYNRKFFDTDSAKEGGPVKVKATGEIVPHFTWRKALLAKDSNGNISERDIPAGKQPGDTFTVTRKGKTTSYTVVEGLQVYDPTQVGMYSGKGNLHLYLAMAKPFAEAFRQADPNKAKLIVGWDFHFYQMRWDAFRVLHAPTIDALIDHIDGISEHHYGSDPLATAASYEVAVAYTVTKHGKWIHCYNTETGGKLDPAVHGKDNLDKQSRSHRAASAYSYGVRDIMYMLYHCPDKAMSRTTHMPENPEWGAGGDEFYFKLLKPVRGKLLYIENYDPNGVWAVASYQQEKNEMAVALYNESNKPRAIKLSLLPPTGQSWGAGHEKRQVSIDSEDKKLTLEVTATKPQLKAGQTQAIALDDSVGPREAVVYTFKLLPTQNAKTQKAAVQTINRTQHFSKDILRYLGKQQTLRTSIDLGDEYKPEQVKTAYLKLAVHGLGWREGVASINGHKVDLPAGNHIQLIPISPDWLKKQNEIVIGATGPQANGFGINMTSIVIDVPVTPEAE